MAQPVPSGEVKAIYSSAYTGKISYKNYKVFFVILSIHIMYGKKCSLKLQYNQINYWMCRMERFHRPANFFNE